MKYLFVTLAVTITYCNDNTVQAAHQTSLACQSTGFYLIESDKEQTKHTIGEAVITPVDFEKIELSHTGDILFGAVVD